MVVKGREDLYNFFDEHSIRYLKSNANSVMMILENEKDAIDFTDGMLKEGVILRRVNAFGLPNCIRITIGQQKEMEHFKRSFLEVMEASIN